MRRRNKPRVCWLPPTAEFSVDDAGIQTWGTFSFPITATTGGRSGAAEVPLVLDGLQSSPLDPTSSLADIENSGYRLRRIVGELYVFLAQSQDPTVNPDKEDIYGVTAGLMVRRINEVSGASLAGATSQVFPDDILNSMDPWVWRRSWVLSNGPVPSTGIAGTGLTNGYFNRRSNRGPTTNFGKDAGTVWTGPHIDQKTARIVGPETRLFLDVSGSPLLASGDDTSVVVFYNLRVLASMRPTVGNRRNATR